MKGGKGNVKGITLGVGRVRRYSVRLRKGLEGFRKGFASVEGASVRVDEVNR